MLDAENTETVETPVEAPETVQDPAGDVEVVETPEAQPEAAETAETDAPEAESTEEVETPAPTTFDAELPVEELVTKTAEVLDGYELPEPVQAAFDALRARVTTVQNDPLEPYKVYGEPENIKVLLDHRALLDDHVEENGVYRPRTNEFAQTLTEKQRDYLFYDLATTPSSEYTGHSKFEEGIIDLFGKQGDAPETTLERYKQFTQAMQTGSFASDVPDFIPAQLREAFFDLPKQERDFIELLDNEVDADEIKQKVDLLTKIQRGIDSQKQDEVRTQQSRAAQEQQFTLSVIQKETAFYGTLRTAFVGDLKKNVVFSTNPQTQELYSNSIVSLVTDAFSDGFIGESARAALSTSGISLDTNKVQQLMKDVEKASIELTEQERLKNPDGTPLNQIAFNKAKNNFENVARNWQAFSKNIVEQAAKAASEGKADEVKAEVAKIKIAAKSRPAPKGVGSAVTTQEKLPTYGTYEWDKYWANKTLTEQAQKARAYA